MYSTLFYNFISFLLSAETATSTLCQFIITSSKIFFHDLRIWLNVKVANCCFYNHAFVQSLHFVLDQFATSHNNTPSHLSILSRLQTCRETLIFPLIFYISFASKMNDSIVTFSLQSPHICPFSTLNYFLLTV